MRDGGDFTCFHHSELGNWPKNCGLCPPWLVVGWIAIVDENKKHSLTAYPRVVYTKFLVISEYCGNLRAGRSRMGLAALRMDGAAMQAALARLQ